MFCMKIGKAFGTIAIASFLIFCATSNNSSSSNKSSSYNTRSSYNSSSSSLYNKSQTPKEIKYTCSNGATYTNYGDYNECEKRISWEKTRDESLADCNADPNKFNCWFAICRDGTSSTATGRGACSHHGGVSQWLTR